MSTTRITLALTAALALGACEVQSTPEDELPPEVNIEDGQVDMDSVDVDIDVDVDAPDVDLPDVDLPDVDLRMDSATIPVPKIDVHRDSAR